MNDFWAGFEKRGKSKDSAGNKIKDVAVGGAATLVVNTAAGAALIPALLLDKNMSAADKELLTMQGNIGMKNPINPITHEGIEGVLMSAYRPETHTVESINRAGVLSHELGHAKSFQGPARQMSSFNRARILMHSNPVLFTSMAAPLIGAVSDNEKVREAAPYTALIAAPMVAEEAGASIRGLKNIAMSLGLKRALRAAPSLAAAGLTYATIPGVAAYMAHRMAKKRRKTSK